MNKRFVIILAVLVLGFVSLLLLGRRDPESSNKTGGSTKSQPSNHVLGEGETGVTLTEFGDLQCPACAQYHPVVKQIVADYGDKIKFRFRHFPLQSIHQNALISSRAAEAAGLQGKFFEMHDMLYQTQTTWAEEANPTQIFESYAQQLGLNLDQFQKDMRSDRVNRIVKADLSEANDKGYSSTPTFEINGKQIQTPRDMEGFKKLIDDAIKKATQQ